MIASCDYLPENIYSFNPNTTRQQLMNAVHRSLLQSEALALIATIIDIDVVCKETFDNYLWALCDIIQEAKTLYEKVKELL